MISIWNLDSTSVQWLDKRRKISSLRTFNTWHEQRNTWGWTRENMQVPKDWEKWKYAIATDERNKKVRKKEIWQDIKNDTEIWAKCQEYNYSSFSS